jgi:hypothetical protein
MFSAYCKHCGTVLLGPANVRSIHNTSSGIVLYFRCNAGHSGVWLTGRRSSSRIRGASSRVAARQDTDSPLTTSSGPSSSSNDRPSWWRRGARRRPLRSRPARRPGAADSRAG